jgi:hypothetical protein
MTDFDDDPIYPEVPGHVAGSETSAAAAESVREKAASMRSRIEACFFACGEYGMTDDEVEELLGFRHQTASPRRRELELDGALVGTGRKRETRSGRMAQVYVHIERAGPELLRATQVPPIELSPADRALLARLSGNLMMAVQLPTLEPPAKRLLAAIEALLDRAGASAPDAQHLKEHQLVLWPAVA